MSLMDFPNWFKDAVFLAVLSVTALVITEWIKGKIRYQQSKKNGHGHTLTIDNEIIERFLNIYEKNVKVQQETLDLLREQKQELADQKQILEEHVEKSAKPARLITEIHEKIIGGP
jgi:hypothetical protein